jgi:hypothetical protein
MRYIIKVPVRACISWRIQSQDGTWFRLAPPWWGGTYNAGYGWGGYTMWDYGTAQGSFDSSTGCAWANPGVEFFVYENAYHYDDGSYIYNWWSGVTTSNWNTWDTQLIHRNWTRTDFYVAA